MLHPPDEFGGSYSSFAQGFLSGRRRWFQRQTYLRYAARGGFKVVSVEESDSENVAGQVDTVRRLSSAAATACGAGCGANCRNESSTKEELTSCQLRCYGVCDSDVSNVTDSDVSNVTDSDVSNVTDGDDSNVTDSDNSEATAAPTSVTATETTTMTMSMTTTTMSMSTTTMSMTTTSSTTDMNTTLTMTTTSTSTTSLPPAPVRLVQLSGDVFNVGDPLPD
ncbi:unnamed protein product, partial [Effrenium voratum]